MFLHHKQSLVFPKYALIYVVDVDLDNQDPQFSCYPRCHISAFLFSELLKLSCVILFAFPELFPIWMALLWMMIVKTRILIMKLTQRMRMSLC